MHHVGLDLTFLNPEAGSSTRGQSQGSEWRGDFLAELFSLDLNLERYLGTGEPDEFAKHLLRGVTEGSAESRLPPDSQGENSQPAQGSILFSEANQEIPQSSAQTPVLLPTEEAVRVEPQPADLEGGEGRTSEAGVGVVSGRSGVVPAGRQISTSLSGFNRAVVGWGQGGGTARHLGSNPAEVFFNGPASEREGLSGVVPGRVSENQGSGRDQIVNSQGRPEIADSGSPQGVPGSRQIEVAENPRDLVNQLNSSVAAKQTQILQDRLWLPNGAAALDEGAATQWWDRTGQGGKTLTESPSVPASRTVLEVVGNRESPDATRQPPEAATTRRSSGTASEPGSAAESRKEGQETTTRPPDSAARERPDTSASRSSSTARGDGEHQDGARRPAESGASGSDVVRGSASAEQTYSLDRSGFKAGDVWRSLSRMALPPNLGPALQGFPGREGYLNTRGMFDGHSDPGGGQDRAPQETRPAAGEHSKVPSGPDIQPKRDFVEPEGSVRPSSARPHTHSPSLPTDRQGNFVQPKDVFNSPSARISTDGTRLSPDRQGSAAQPEPSANNSIARPPGDGAWLSAARPGLGSGVAATASEIVVQNPERVARLPFQFEAQSPPKQKVEGVEQGDGEERMPEAGFKRGPESGLESKSALEHEATSRSRPRSFSEAAPKEENSLKRSVRAQLSPSPKQTPVTDVVGRQRGNESGVDPERAAGTGGGSRGLTQASSGPPRTVEPSVLQEGPVRPVAARPLASTAESSSQPEQGARSVPDSPPQSRTGDVGWKVSQQGSEEDSPNEAKPVRIDRDSRSQSQETSGEKVSLTSTTGRVPSESSVAKGSVDWAKEMGGPTVKAGAERLQPRTPTREGQEAGRPVRAEAEATHVSTLEGRILKAGLGPRSILPGSESNPATFRPERGTEEIFQGRVPVQVKASQVLEQSDPIVDQNAKSAAEPWAWTPTTLGKDLRGENRERQRQSPRGRGSVEQPTRLGEATPPASSNLRPDESIRGGEGVAPRPEEHPEPEPDTRQPKKAFVDSDQQDSHRPRTTEDKAVDPREYSSERVWKAGESKGLFQAGTADRAVDLSLPSKGTPLEAGNPSQGQVGSNSSSRSAGGSQLSSQSIPVWLQSPSAFVDSVAHRFVQHSRFLRNGETIRFDIELKPEFLGKIRIKTSLNHKNELTVEIKVDDPDVRETLEQRLPALVEKLQAMGVEPDRLKVDGFSSHSQSDAQQQEGQRRGQPGAGKTWSQRGADEGEEESSDWPEDIEGEGIHYFA